jgi:hypothetical protein
MKGLAAALKAIAKAAPGLREAGVSALRLDGLGEIILTRPPAAPGARPALAAPDEEAKGLAERARTVLRTAGGLSETQTDDLMADLRRFD